MTWWHRLVRRRRLEADLDDEIAFHRQMRAEDLDAPRFGNETRIKESVREAWSLGWIEAVGQDVRYALRQFRRTPSFAVTAIVSLALGIGASVGIFTIADNLLVRPLPYPNSSRLMILWETSRRQSGMGHNVVSPADYFDWRAQNDVFEDVAAFRQMKSVLTDGSYAEELDKQQVSAQLLPMLGVRPIRGRLFTAAEDRAAQNSDSVVLISYRLWQNWFGGDEGVIGRLVKVNATPRTIIGVLPPSFYFWDRQTDLWEPLGLNPAEDYRKTQGRWMMTLAQLKPGIRRERAQAEMTTIGNRLARAFPAFNEGWTVTVEPLREALVGEVRTSLLVLLGGVGLMLAVACTNVANLLLARFASRQQEMAVRAAIGASRWRIVRQLLTESVLIGLVSGLMGVSLARWLITGLWHLAPRSITDSSQISFDFRIFLFAIGLSILTSVLFGLFPSLVASRSSLSNPLNQQNRSNTGSGNLRELLIAAEVAISAVLLAGAALLFGSFVRLQNVAPGLRPGGVLTFRVSLPAARYQSPTSRLRFSQDALQKIAGLPGVQIASAVSYIPFHGMAASTWVNIEGRPAPKPGEELLATIRTVVPGYFRTMGIPLKGGRDFTTQDNRPEAPYSFVVNEAFVKKYLARQDPFATSINSLMDQVNPYGRIIGVVGDVKEGALNKEAVPTVYYPYAHLTYSAMNFVVRTNGNPIALADSVRQVIRQLDPAQPVAEVDTMDHIVAETFARERVSALLLTVFSIISVLLAAVGIYGVLAYAVSERNREIGIRVALGAKPAEIAALVVKRGLRLTLIGLAIGIAGAFAVSGILKGLLFETAPRDPMTFALVAAMLILVAMIASYLPARRAARIDPNNSLRA